MYFVVVFGSWQINDDDDDDIHFSRWQPAAILDLIWVMLDHPRIAIVGLSLILKFGLDRTCSF